MKAIKIYERLDFERGLDPKQSMGMGQQVRDKKKLIALLSDPGKFPSSVDAKFQFDYMVKVIMESSTKVRFEKKHESTPGDGRIVIILPPSLTNVFFFEVLNSNITRNNNIESYHWDNPTNNTMNIWINS
jgi:hypothetical protein